MTYAGIKITNTTSPAATLNFIKISNGQYDVDEMVAGGVMRSGAPVADVLLTSVAIDTAANTISGYDSSGNRYIVDKAGSVSTLLSE